ncbi:hypothetical protein ASPZODRAFT_160536 [Penicilliopsis zonata CBS 506.65]|uniref:Fluoride ion transporter CrcB n=1 Tax=Penicilliopsis zonata CBS 506.65 TaxID=1073090 RepID=A0A1L9SD08_9EURO|nr:hypothetical protein ASPZODRAFT_160536 [Penicilliopsis zonata CBS 506.65]OJJ45049.1 hypothetical protein ASPZODRAFT_160536 [Penicilliopsis zonata CBS 506.65]
MASFHQVESNLDEIAAPSPIYDPSEQPVRREEEERARLLPPTLCTLGYLVFFSIAGTLLRVAVESLTFYPGTPLNTSVVWANVGGSVVMGFLSEDKKLFMDNTGPAGKKSIPLYIGLTTGFCGSFTSFSTFIRDAFLALSNDLSVPVVQVPSAPNGGFSFMALLAVLFTEIGLSLAGLMLGAHLALAVQRWTPRLPRWIYTVLDPLVVILAVLAWVAVICLAVLLGESGQNSTLWSSTTWRGPVLYALALSPPGCLARFFLSMELNGRLASFPLGTFAANSGGTAILGMAYALQHSTAGGSGIIPCQVLQGVMDGFCGCLTTVSTWVLELSGLRRRHAYFYGGASVLIGLCLLIVEIGSLKWSIGLATPACFDPVKTEY